MTKRSVFETLPEAVKEAQRLLDHDAEFDRVMILPEPLPLGAPVPKMEGVTALLGCTEIKSDDWHIVTRDDYATSR